MLDPRLYRVAFVPVLLALLVAAFSLQDRPRPIGTTQSPEGFDGFRAQRTLQALATPRFRDRRPGSAGDERLAAYVADQLRESVPGTVEEHRYEGETIDGKRELVDVVATRPGQPGPGLVVVAHRDAAGPGATAELSATAALLELARVAADGRLRRTITFISTSGGSGGFAGAREEARRMSGRADAVLVLGDVAGARGRHPFVVAASDGRGQAPIQLQRTVQRALRAELGTEGGSPRALTQWLRMAVPVTISEQGAFLRAGQPAVLLSASGERPPAIGERTGEGRMKRFGRSALRVLYALDNFRDLAAAPRDDLVIRGKVLPGWAVRLLVGALLLPPLFVGVDALARLRRRHRTMGLWAVWTLAGAVPFLLACLFAVLLARVGLIAAAPDAPIPAQALELGSGPVTAFVAIVLVFALGWLVARPALLHATGAMRVRKREPDAPGAVVAVGLVTVAVTAALWVGNPYAAALAIPAAHIWLWALTPDLRLPRSASLAIVLLALLPLLVVASVDGRAFGLDVAHGGWFWTLLVAGGHVPVGTWVLWSFLWGCAVAAGLVAVSRRRPEDDEPDQITTRGPVTYAGPGSLGNVGQTVRR
ncbi:MAG TPA: M28 family peptidase [Baekduia sp.]|nr:M28 family peptidase [Baekduia sp.]